MTIIYYEVEKTSLDRIPSSIDIPYCTVLYYTVGGTVYYEYIGLRTY